ncbi:uncharacterized protein A1O9_00750 [Exophiala aquamarina CBS 119918]|uniref:Cytochrome P450 oxidoreductase n=1 Tax=Exophiala aquamarina CBS 119918 TaxID=1182545 RepID=A0A072PST3_9EURO|nr:uncharacterized protein A1O9_00750 [Exophiala aquamarina CBS 119918]KEF62777.1 hypothetical protein A1O9_00750 [Exophiala aquamarina CBS 119918]
MFICSSARIGPNLLVTDDSELLRHLSAPRSKWARGGWYGGVKFDPRMNNILSERDEKKHAEMRDKLIVLWKRGRTLELDIDSVLVKALGHIRREYIGKGLDIAQIASYFTLDVLIRMAFEDSFGFVEANSDLYDYHVIANKFFGVLELVVNHENLQLFVQNSIVQRLLAPKGKDKVGQGAIIGIAQKAVSERFRPDARVKKDMLGHFLAKGMTQEEAEVESHLQIIAESDSTAGTLRTTMMLLVAKPGGIPKTCPRNRQCYRERHCLVSNHQT